MGAYEIEQYIKLYQQMAEAEDEAVREALREKAWKVWYYYMSPADKKVIERNAEAQTEDP